jgi:hypothetical protein
MHNVASNKPKYELIICDLDRSIDPLIEFDKTFLGV